MLNVEQKPVITVEQLRRARQLFEQSSMVKGAARTRTLDETCNGDPVLRMLVEEMIEASEREHPLLDRPLLTEDLCSGIELRPETRIGAYRVLRPIGDGGMGTVYLADRPDQSPDQLYAIKVVRYASPDLLRRFQQEQVILHGLQHPNIARYVDAGTTEARSPYFVMEYVEGLPIDRYIGQQRLTTQARIKLFRQVCTAVRYLHQHLVVHRDLKPANILVTAQGTIKLVDFGISKLLQFATADSTNTCAGLMTPDYASPEQIRGGAISTLTDVYALGALLYQILTHTKPFGSQGELQETLRRICEEEPLRPSVALRMAGGLESECRELRGELDNIVLKALEKQPDRRYGSVEQLDDDLARYEAGLPVLAQGDSAFYRVQKLVARHKGSIAAGFAILALLVGGIVATTGEARIARREAERARLHSSEAERQRTLAEVQTQIARQERDRAEHQTEIAQRERQNAERRLKVLQQLASGAAEIYTSARSSSPPPGEELIARFAQNSLVALKSERGLRASQLQLLDTLTADVQSYQLAGDRSWTIPIGWSASETRPHEYRVGLDHKVRHGGGSSLFLRSLVPVPSGRVLVSQTIDAAVWRGKRVRLTGFVRAEKVTGQTALGMALLNDRRKSLAYEAITLSGTSGWKRQAIVLDVPPTCKLIQLHLQLSSAGTLWADDFSFEVVSKSVPLTHRTQPENLSFATQ